MDMLDGHSFLYNGSRTNPPSITPMAIRIMNPIFHHEMREIFIWVVNAIPFPFLINVDDDHEER